MKVGKLVLLSLPRAFFERLGRIWARVFLISFLAVLAGCNETPVTRDFVARVGDSYLTREELSLALQSMPAALDTVEASHQIIERWVTNELLFQEARRRRLLDKPEVKKLLRENERSVLISAYINDLYAEHAEDPPMQSVELYYEQHKDQLLLREPYVRVRYLSNASLDSTRLARQLLQAITEADDPDAAWTDIASRFSEDPEASTALGNSFFPTSRLFNALPSVRDALKHLRVGEVSAILPADGQFHIVQLVDQKSAGSVPEISWVVRELKDRLTIEARKQMYARQVQRLKNEAIAREDLEVK